jgi:16S rRNA (cytidine1402-2'-O)-methyltransferase
VGTLYLVSTPIGNLGDISSRALQTLRDVTLIAAEDTRHTKKLLSHFDIHTRLTSYFEHNKLIKLESILAALAEGDVALVSDAGTPSINDPGFELVRAALTSGYNVSPVPGPSALIAGLSASGLPTDSFLYLGYLPRRSSERKARLTAIAGLPFTLIFLEAPHRLLDSLADMESVLANRPVAVARELTKLHEEIWRGTLEGARTYFQKPRGEFVLIVDGRSVTAAQRQWSEQELLAEIHKRTKRGELTKEISAALADVSGWKKRDIYRLIAKIN